MSTALGVLEVTDGVDVGPKPFHVKTLGVLGDPLPNRRSSSGDQSR
jgi:hypothetical protein